MLSADYHDLRARAEAQADCRVDPANPVWIFGAGGFGQALSRAMRAHGLRVAGFVETAPRSAELQGLPVLDWGQLRASQGDADVALGIFNRSMPFDHLLDTAASEGFNVRHLPWTLYEQFSSSLGWRYWLSDRGELLDGLDRVSRVGQMLEDDASVQTLYRICAFRLGLDTSFASFQSSDAPYFNDLSLTDLRGRPITYVDCGAYNGDTYCDLLGAPGIDCAQAFLLEPDPTNFAALVQRTAQRGNGAVCLPLAVAERLETLNFDVDRGEASALLQPAFTSTSPTAGRPVTAVGLDQLLPSSRVDLLKFDVEGAEAQALRGATQMIRDCRPVLALSLYHHPRDLWELPELLFSLCPRYKFYVRQHGFNSFDCILYAVPEASA